MGGGKANKHLIEILEAYDNKYTRSVTNIYHEYCAVLKEIAKIKNERVNKFIMHVIFDHVKMLVKSKQYPEKVESFLICVLTSEYRLQMGFKKHKVENDD